jgi:hypothetical protein
MKNVIIYVCLSFLVMLLHGCKNGGDVSESSRIQALGSHSTDSRKTTMIVGKKYVLKEGDQLLRNATDTVVILESDINSGKTIAILKKGEALLITK